MSPPAAKSSHVHSMGDRDGDLFVRFGSGAVYKYAGAGHLCADGLKAESAGKWFHAEINGKFRHEKVSPVNG